MSSDVVNLGAYRSPSVPNDTTDDEPEEAGRLIDYEPRATVINRRSLDRLFVVLPPRRRWWGGSTGPRHGVFVGRATEWYRYTCTRDYLLDRDRVRDERDLAILTRLWEQAQEREL